VDGDVKLEAHGADGGSEAPSAPPASRPILDLDRPIWRSVLALAWPVLLQQYLILSVTLSDRFLAGRVVTHESGEALAAQAAQTTANYLAWFISSYIVMVSVGATALVGRLLGGGDRDKAVAATNQALLLAVGMGVLGTVAWLLAGPAVLRWMQLGGAAADFAEEYLRPLFLLLVFQVIETAGIACLAGAGDTRTGLWVLGGVAVINVPLAWAFFHGIGPVPALGFPGIALGTALSHTLGGLAVLIVLARGRAGLRLRWRLLAPRWDLIYRLLRVSIPAAADSLSVAVAQLWYMGIVNGLGDAASGAHGIAIGWEAMGFQSGAAFATSAMALVSQNLGAGRPDRAARSAWTAFALGGLLMALMGVIFYAFAPAMFALFCPRPEQAPIIDVGVPVLRLVAFAMPALASCIIFTGALRGAGDTRLPVLFTWVGFFALRIPLAYLLTGPAFGLGLLGAWLAMFADLLVRGVFFAARFAGGRWQRMWV
jgi:putative MATE family efflux protein